MKNKEIVKQAIKDVDELIGKVKGMTGDEFKAVLDSMSHFHRYSMNNQFILLIHGCSQVAGFKQWQKDHNRRVKKGSKAVWILAPQTYKVPVDDFRGCYDKRDIVTEEGTEYVRGMTFRAVPVFDIADTEGEPIKRGLTKYSDISLDTVKEKAEKLGYNVFSRPLPIAKGGHILDNDITLNSNLSETENTGTLIHELAHGELGHQSDNDTKSRDFREQEAEAVTYIVCKQLGIDRKSEFYCKSWSMTENIRDSFKEISAAVKNIIDVF